MEVARSGRGAAGAKYEHKAKQRAMEKGERKKKILTWSSTSPGHEAIDKGVPNEPHGFFWSLSWS